MFKGRYLLLLIALATVGGVGYVLRLSEARTAESLFAAAVRRLESESPDFDAALREMDRALEMSLEHGDAELASEIFLLRARTYVERGVLNKARDDFNTILSDYTGTPEVAIEIADIDLALGHHGQALEAATAVLTQDPTNPHALTLQGRALYETGALAMEQAEEIFDAMLPDEEAELARALAWRAATLDFDHPHRAATMVQLANLPAPLEELEGIQRFVDAATSCMTQARTSLVGALERDPSPEAAIQLIILLERGGRWNDVVSFGIAATQHAEVQLNLDALTSLVKALDELNRPAFAASILTGANESRLVLPRELMGDWCRLLYEAGEWNRLEGVGNAAKNMAGPDGRDLRAFAALFRGFALLNLKRFEEARQEFLTFLQEPPRVRPIPDARAWAQYGMAQAWGAEGRRYEEHLNLKRATGSSPELGAEVWAALGESQLKQKFSPASAADSYFQAINLAMAPQRPALIKRWEELSEIAMKERKRTLDGSEELARSRQLYVLRGDPKAPTWEFYALGMRYAERRQFRGTLEAGRAIVALHPNHVLGLDLLIEAHAGMQEWTKAMELLLRRAELHGPHPETWRFARIIPRSILKPAEYLKLMEFDPQSTGLLRMVEELEAEGRTDLAIEGLASLRPEERSAEASLTLARLYRESGLLQQAIRAAGEVSSDAPEYARAIELAFLAAADIKKPGVFENLVPELLSGAARANLEPTATERAALWLHAHGQFTGARALLATLDRRPVRTNPRLAAFGLVQLSARRLAEAENSLDRAEAFGAEPDAQIGRLAFLAEANRWTEIPGEVEGLLALEEYTPSLWVDIALLSLAERVREAAAAAAQALTLPDAEPELHLVLAASNALLPEEDRIPSPDDLYAAECARFLTAVDPDPRTTLVLLCALETPSGAAWAHSHLLGTGSMGGRIWPRWLMSRACDKLGQPLRANENLEALVRNSPKFLPAWERLEADLLAAEGSKLSAGYAAFLERRAIALEIDSADDPLTSAILRVQRLVRKGDMIQALEFLERIRPSLTESAVGLITDARVLRLAGLRPQAVRSFSEAIHAVPPAEAAVVVDEFLALGTQAFLEGTLTAEAWRAELAALLSRLPNNPTVSLAWARFERQITEDPVQGWELALGEYTRFRVATKFAPLDELRPGSAAAWAEFFVSESPAEAQLMIEDELLRSPGSPDLWRLYGQSLEEQGRVDDAFERYFAVSNMLPDPASMRLAAEILAERGSNHRQLEIMLDRIAAAERTTGLDPSLELLRARSLSHSGVDGVSASIPVFEKLWAFRELLRSPRARVDLAESYAAALLHRGFPEDGPFIQEILDEVLPRVTDPLRRDMLLAYRHLSRWIPIPEPEPVAAAPTAGPGQPGPGGEAQPDRPAAPAAPIGAPASR